MITRIKAGWRCRYRIWVLKNAAEELQDILSDPWCEPFITPRQRVEMTDLVAQWQRAAERLKQDCESVPVAGAKRRTS